MQNITPEALYTAINKQAKELLYAVRATAPAGGHCNPLGLVLYGNTISWHGFGGVSVTYDAVRMKWLRRTAYAQMHMAHYITDIDLLHHYFIHMTPSVLLFDAAIQIGELKGDTLCAIKLN